MALTDLQCRKAKPREKDYALTDGDGLSLKVRATGGKSWLGDFLRLGSEAFSDVMTPAELQRQLGRFDETLETLQQVPVDQKNEMFTLIRHLAEGKNPAPTLLRGC